MRTEIPRHGTNNPATPVETLARQTTITRSDSTYLAGETPPVSYGKLVEAQNTPIEQAK